MSTAVIAGSPHAERVVRWLTPAVAERTFDRWRRWTGLAMLAYLVVRAPVLVDAGATWQPVGVLRALTIPLGGRTLFVLWVAATLGAVGLAVGRVVRSSAVVMAIAVFVLLTHRSSGGQILWFDVLPALHCLVLAAGLSVQPLRRHDARTAGWSLRLAGLVAVTTYVLAGVAKLRIGGAEWVADGILERHISYSAMRLDVLGGTASPLAAPLVDLGIASAPLAIGVLVIELGAPVALVSRRWAMVWSLAAWLMHAVIATTMFVVFHWPLLGVAFAPLVLAQQRQDSPAASRSA